MADIIQLRRDTAANWVTANPVLHDGEIGIETDTRKRKCGNGTTAWNSLPYMYSDDLDQEPTANSHKPVESGGVYNFVHNYFTDYAFVTNGTPILDTTNKTFTLPAGTYVCSKGLEISSLANDVVWNRSDASALKAGGFLVLNLVDFSHRVVPIPNLPNCSNNECVVAYVNWWQDIMQGNFFQYYVDGKLWRSGHIEITKNRTSSAKISVKVLEDCLFFLPEAWVTISASDNYIDTNNTQTVLLGIEKNANGIYSLALKSYSAFYDSEFFVITSIFYSEQDYHKIISSVDGTYKTFITYSNAKCKRIASEWAYQKIKEDLTVDNFSKQFVYNKEKVLDLLFSVTDSSVATRSRTEYLNLIPGDKYTIVQNGHTGYLYQVLNSSSQEIDGGYRTQTYEYTVPDNGIIQVMLKKSDNSEFTIENIAEINDNKVFELYHNKAVIQDNNHLAQNNVANLWGSTEFLDGYFYGISPNSNPVTYQGLTANAAMTCCEVVVKPGTRLYTFTPYLMLAYLDENRNFVGYAYYTYSTTQPTTVPRVTDVPWNAVYAQISTRLSYKYETVVTECPFPSVGLESYRNVSKQLIPKSQIVHQELNRIYDRKDFVSNAAQNNLSFVGTVTLNNGKLALSIDSGVYITGEHTTIDRSTIRTDVAITTLPSSGKILRFGYYGSKIAGTGISNCDTWIDVYANKVELYEGNLSGTTSTKKAESNLSESIAANDNIQLIVKKDTIYHHVVKVLKRYVVIGELELTATVDPNNSDQAFNQMRSWGAPAIWTGTGAAAIVNRLSFYSDCSQYAKLAIVGDSYVENKSRSKASGWVRLLEEKIGKENVFVSGQGGAGAGSLITKLPVELNLCRPKYVILHTGTNDAGTGTQSQIDNYKTRLLQLIDMVKAVNAIPILMTTPRVVNGGNDDLAFITTINPWIKSLGYKYVDIAYCLSTGDSTTLDTNRMMSDKTHPNHVGAQAIMNWVENNLQEIL